MALDNNERSPPPTYQQQPQLSVDPIISQIPPLGLSSTSSQFRTPMAVMDLYTARYARPALEPYRPPALVQQLYRPEQPQIIPQHHHHHYQTSVYQSSPALPPQQTASKPVIRKPFD